MWRLQVYTTGLYTLCHTPSECVPGINRDWLIEAPYLSVKYRSSGSGTSRPITNSAHNNLGPLQTRPIANSAHGYRKVPFVAFTKDFFSFENAFQTVTRYK